MSLDQEVATTRVGEVVRVCQEYVANLLGRPADGIDPDADFDRLGIDSSLAVGLLAELEERYDVDLPPEALFENPTINAVAELVEQQSQA